jgi:subtilase family serine protease
MATLTATVANIGTANAGGVVVRFLDGTQVLGTSAAIGLNAGASGQLGITWSTAAALGTHTITAIVDPDNWVPEASEANNKAVGTITIK